MIHQVADDLQAALTIDPERHMRSFGYESDSDIIILISSFQYVVHFLCPYHTEEPPTLRIYTFLTSRLGILPVKR